MTVLFSLVDALQLEVNTGYTYANGLTITYEYDTIGNVKKILKNGTAIYSCEYDANMQLIREQDYEANTETQYFYTDAGSLYLSRKTCGDDVILSYSVTDDETGKTDHITEINGTKITYSSVYDEETEISKYILPNLEEITSDTDDFGRTTAVYLKDSEGNTLLTCTYTYVDKTVDGAVHTSEYVASMSMGGKTFTYAYDASGNITSVSDGAYVITYVYDNLGQLTRENNQRAGKSWTYTYDTAGNILSKSEYAYTVGELGTATSAVTYGYSNSNWGDQLTSYNGTAISYDSLGNPLNWTDGRTFTWEGRQLSSITSSDETISFTYNADGLRTKKVVGIGEDAYTYEYIWDNGLLVAETEIYYGEETVSYYYYDENGSPVAWNWDGDIYYYVKNQHGDIVKVVDEAGTTQAEYTYDAWGNVLTETGNFYVRTYNPFRYRGYYYDVETELYYLQSRYYDPAIGRFLNADAVDYLGASGTVLGYNLYSYCENDVLNQIDPTGFGFIGVGIQLEIGYGAASCGIEIIWYFSSQVKVNGRNRKSPYFYAYGGFSAGYSATFKSTINKIIKNPSILFKPKSILTGWNMSACVFAVYGYSNFTKPDHYLGSSTESYGSFNHVKAYTAWGSSCFTIGIGASSNYISAGRSSSWYYYFNDVSKWFGNKLNNIYDTVKKIGSSI